MAEKLLFLIFFIVTSKGYSPNVTSKKITDNYACTPCGQECDKDNYNAPGSCTHCMMKLVKKNTIVFRNIRPVEFCDVIKKHPETILLDVRTKEEFAGTVPENFGRLKNAINIPVQELENRIGELQKYKKREIIVYCSHSHRSPQSSYILNQHGFTKVTNLLGGMSIWNQEVKDASCSKEWLIK